MSYYWLNTQELLRKAKEKYDHGDKEKPAEYYQANKDVIKEKEEEERGRQKNRRRKKKKRKKQKDSIPKIGFKK